MNFVQNNIQSLAFFKPELVLCTGILLTFLGDLLVGSKWLNITLSFVVLALASFFLVEQLTNPNDLFIFNKLLLVDRYSTFFKLLFIATTFFTLLIILKSREFKGAGIAEVIIFLFTITLGMMILASTTDLLIIYLAMETVSLVSYVLVGYKMDSRPSSEAALKYIIFGGVASGIMLFGMSYLFGMFGTTNIALMKNAIALATGTYSYPVLFAVLMVMVGFGFKVAMVPFHMWCPDVYEGAPTPITAFLSVGPKAAGFAILIRFIFLFFAEGGDFLTIFESIKMPGILIFLSIITMTLGNLAAISQNNLKRLLAYSSIAHAGYMLMGFCAFTKEGVEAVLFYLPIYLFMNVGAFLIVTAVRDETGSEDIQAYRGLGNRNPYLSVAMTVFLFSLVGLPPLAGFLGKFYLFAAVIHKGLYVLATIGVINSVISLFYYVRVVKTMFVEDLPDALQKKEAKIKITTNNLYKILTAVFIAGNVLLIFYWAPLLKIVRNSSLINF